MKLFLFSLLASLSLCVGGFFTGGSQALADFKVPSLTGPVMDFAGYLRAEDARDLQRLLLNYNEQGKAQIQVLILKDLQGVEIEDASIKITDAWKLGEKKKDNGVLFLVGAAEHRMRIEVGRGLEGTLTDLA